MHQIRSGIRDQRGFTLVEIMMLIVLLGIIAAIAIPKYIDLRTEAANATASSIVGAIVSSAAIGYADLVTHKSATTFPNFTALNNTYLLNSTYLQAQNITLNADVANSRWTALIGGTTYTFNYNPTTGDANWTK